MINGTSRGEPALAEAASPADTGGGGHGRLAQRLVWCPIRVAPGNLVLQGANPRPRCPNQAVAAEFGHYRPDYDARPRDLMDTYLDLLTRLQEDPAALSLDDFDREFEKLEVQLSLSNPHRIELDYATIDGTATFVAYYRVKDVPLSSTSKGGGGQPAELCQELSIELRRVPGEPEPVWVVNDYRAGPLEPAR